MQRGDRHRRRARAQPRSRARCSRRRSPIAAEPLSLRPRRAEAPARPRLPAAMRAACSAPVEPQAALELALAHLELDAKEIPRDERIRQRLTRTRRAALRGAHRRRRLRRRCARENLARWPTGAAVDFDEAVALPSGAAGAQAARPRSCARAVAERRCLTQPRGGFGTFDDAARADGDARHGRPRRHRADDDRQLHAQRAMASSRRKASRNPSAGAARC